MASIRIFKYVIGGSLNPMFKCLTRNVFVDLIGRLKLRRGKNLSNVRRDVVPGDTEGCGFSNLEKPCYEI